MPKNVNIKFPNEGDEAKLTKLIMTSLCKEMRKANETVRTNVYLVESKGL
jgi:hypothetical protein